MYSTKALQLVQKNENVILYAHKWLDVELEVDENFSCDLRNVPKRLLKFCTCFFSCDYEKHPFII